MKHFFQVRLILHFLSFLLSLPLIFPLLWKACWMLFKKLEQVYPLIICYLWMNLHFQTDIVKQISNAWKHTLTSWAGLYRCKEAGGPEIPLCVLFLQSPTHSWWWRREDSIHAWGLCLSQKGKMLPASFKHHLFTETDCLPSIPQATYWGLSWALPQASRATQVPPRPPAVAITCSFQNNFIC